MGRSKKGNRIFTLELLLVVVLVFIGAMILIPWGVTEREKEDEEQEYYHPRRILVEFKEEKDPHEVMKVWGGSIIRKMPYLDLYKVRTPAGLAVPQAAESLMALGGVKRLEPDFLAPGFQAPEETMEGNRWGLEAIAAQEAWKYSKGDPMVVIAVIDTGVDSEHPKVIHRVLNGFSPLVRDPDVPIPYHDTHGRGTHVTGVAAGSDGVHMVGVAPQVSIVSIKTHDQKGGHYRGDLLEGLLWLSEWIRVWDEQRVIALMCGGYRYESPFLQMALNRLQEQGVVLIAGAGDQGGDQRMYPAAAENVLAVGAVDEAGKRTSFSNYGPWVPLAAPGKEIYSSIPGGGYGMASGTSQAAAYAAGTAALIWSRYPNLLAQEIQEGLVETAISAPGEWGMLNALRAMEFFESREALTEN